MKKIGILGHFGGKEEFFDGQTVKTKILYDELLKTGSFKIYRADTYYVRKNPLKFVYQTVRCLVVCESVIVLLSMPGRKIIFPFLYLWKKFFKIRLYNDVIGNNLAKYATNEKKAKHLRCFEKNWLEVDKAIKDLEAIGVHNGEILPNIKRIEAVTEFGEKSLERPYKFCTFSRVMPEKGILDAIEAINRVNHESGEVVATLDIYGPIDEGYKEEFVKLQKTFDNTIRYCGIVDYRDSVNVLKDYYVLLFPTLFETEGFPGTVLDAFFAGIPVFATDKSANGEVVKDGYAGFVYPNGNMLNLYDCVKWSLNNDSEIIKMKKNCLLEAEKYKADKLIKIIVDAIS